MDMMIRDNVFAGSRDVDQPSPPPSFDPIFNKASLHTCFLEGDQHLGVCDNDHPAGLRTDLEAYTLPRYTCHQPWSSPCPYQDGWSSST